MVVLEGSVCPSTQGWQRQTSEDDFSGTFCGGSPFVQDEAFEVTEITSLKDLERASDWYRESNNIFTPFSDGFFK